MNQIQHQRCSCTYRNPVQYICLYPTCKNKRVICQACAWNHRNHEKNVKEISDWESELTNDCVIQRLNHIRTNQTQIQQFTSFYQAIKNEITKIIEQKCNKLQMKAHQEDYSLSKLNQAIKNIAAKMYDSDSIELLVKEFEPFGIHDQLDKYEANQYNRFKPLYNELFNLIDCVNKLYTLCEANHNQELIKLKKTIDEQFKKQEQQKKALEQQPTIQIQSYQVKPQTIQQKCHTYKLYKMKNGNQLSKNTRKNRKMISQINLLIISKITKIINKKIQQKNNRI